MSDDVDITQDRLEKEETQRRNELNKIRYLKGTGYCLNCSEPLNDNRRWCDKYCAEDWEHTLNRRNN
jgi:hypothetical protein